MIKRDLERTRLQITIVKGEDGMGDPIYGNILYPRIVEAISDDDLCAVGQAIGSLQDHVVVRVARLDDSALINEK